MMGEEGTSGPAHSTGVGRGEDIKDRDGKEPGRDDAGTTHADRPAGGSTARDSTAINPDDAESTSDSSTVPPA
jgi:hypothetical protein